MSRSDAVACSPRSPSRESGLRLPKELASLKRSRGSRQPVPQPLKDHALSLLAQGVFPKPVAELIGVTTETLRLWRQKELQPKPTVSTVAEEALADDEESAEGEFEDSCQIPELTVIDGVIDPDAPPIPPAPNSGLSPSEVEAILELKKHHPSMGPAQIQAQLKRFKGWRISIKAIGRLLKKNGYELVHRGSRPRDEEEPKRFEAPHPNALWQMDFAELRVGPEKAPVLLILDDNSRYVVDHELMQNPTSEKVVAVMRRAIRRYGKPEAVYTDRGGPFLAWRHSSSLGRFLEAELIDHHVSRPYKPQGRGKVEALVQTLRRELWEVIHFAGIEEGREGLARFFGDYNHRRAHMGIDGLTPADRYFGRGEEVRARVEDACRRREGALSLGPTPSLPYSDEPGVFSGILEALRLVVVEGKVELRLLGQRVVLGKLRS